MRSRTVDNAAPQLCFAFLSDEAAAAAEPEAATTRHSDSRTEASEDERISIEAGPSADALGADATMAELVALIAADTELAPVKRRNLTSSVRSFVKHLGLDLGMPADFMTYRGHLKRFQPGAARITRARWQNICSDVRFALDRYGARRRPGLPKDLSPDWRKLRSLLDKRRHRFGLSRLFHWCSRNGIEPDEIDDATMAAFHRFLAEETFIHRPDRRFRQVAMLWNEVVGIIPGWPQRPVTLPSFRNVVSLPLNHFPESFAADLARYKRRLEGSDLTADHIPDEPLRPGTIRAHQGQIRRFASAMVRTGRPAEDVRDIPALLEPPWFERTMQSEFERLGGLRPSLQELSATFLAIARHYVRLPDERVSRINDIHRRLRCRTRGFTAKNRERLRAFADPAAQARFLYLGDRLLKMAAAAGSPERAALRVQEALCHELLIAAPMRIGNLVALNLREHFRFGDRERVTIVVPEDEVKNRVELVYELPLSVAQLLERYRERHRPHLLSEVDDGWLFPGVNPGRSKHQATLGLQLTKAVSREAGLAVNPHLYRHLAAFFYLQQHPADFETVRRVLGHKSIATTSQFYADFDRVISIRRYQETVLDRKGQCGSEAPRSKRRRPPVGRGKER